MFIYVLITITGADVIKLLQVQLTKISMSLHAQATVACFATAVNYRCKIFATLAQGGYVINIRTLCCHHNLKWAQ